MSSNCSLKTATTGTKPNKSKAPSAIKTDYTLMKLIIFPFLPPSTYFLVTKFHSAFFPLHFELCSSLSQKLLFPILKQQKPFRFQPTCHSKIPQTISGNIFLPSMDSTSPSQNRVLLLACTKDTRKFVYENILWWIIWHWAVEEVCPTSGPDSDHVRQVFYCNMLLIKEIWVSLVNTIGEFERIRFENLLEPLNST